MNHLPLFRWVVPVLCVASVSVAKADYCTDKFGKYAFVSLYPSSANGKGVEDSIFGARDISDPKRPEPKAFRCVMDSLDNKQKGCPKGMHLVKRPEIAIEECTTPKLKLKELCNTNYLDNWPALKIKTCTQHAN